MNLGHIADCITVHLCHNLTMPDWATEALAAEIDTIKVTKNALAQSIYSSLFESKELLLCRTMSIRLCISIRMHRRV